MIKNVTQEEARKFCESLGYDILNIDDYKNTHTELYLKDKEGYIYKTILSNFKKNKNPNKFHKTNPYTIQNIKLWMKTNAKGYELLSTEYISSHDKMLFKCPNGHEFKKGWSSFQQGHRCPICSNKEVLKGYNDIATTDSWMIDLGVSREDAETHISQSHQKITVTCPNCGKEKEIVISSIYNYKSICCTCSDGTSYPEKFVIELLNQLNIKYVSQLSKTTFKWCDKYKYDFYLHDYNCIIETHGGQHYEQSARGRSLKEEQENDIYKKELALKNGIKYYIELNCRYSDLEHIKNSILNSELNNLFDLSKIDWLKCEEFALSNRIKEVCDYWKEHNNISNENLTTRDIGKVFNLSRDTIVNYLKKGTKLGWCNYNSKEEMKKNGSNNGKKVEIFKGKKSLGVFESCSELSKQSEKLFGIKLNNSKIASVCRGEKPQYKGFTFKYIK